MTPKQEQELDAILKRCQRGTRNYADANALHAECYSAIGLLREENKQLEDEVMAWRLPFKHKLTPAPAP